MANSDAPTSENELREKARTLADSVLIDAALTFAALCHEEGLHGPNPEILIDEWASALQESSQHSREIVEEVRARGVTALIVGNGNEEAEALLNLRIQQLRAVPDDIVEEPEDGSGA